MYSKFYSPNIIATGSSEIDQSSYSHHADNDVGVAVIDRYTYYNLDFLESHVKDTNSKMTLGNLFDSYDESKIHSHPGVRYDLFPGGEAAGRERLVMDFFGNVQNVEVEGQRNETEWEEDLVRLGNMIAALREKDNATDTQLKNKGKVARKPSKKAAGAAKVEDKNGWTRKAMGITALAGCVLVWVVGSWLESGT
jgi:glycosylphosphatidylinositol transamidase (GPIT) subunit GPI8